MRGAVGLAVVLYALGAAFTFNFAYPVNCQHVKTEKELYWCGIDNISDSAVAAVVWPYHWVGRA